MDKSFIQNADQLEFAIFCIESIASADKALDLFYHSTTYDLMRNGISDFHCRSDDYLADELIIEYSDLFK